MCLLLGLIKKCCLVLHPRSQIHLHLMDYFQKSLPFSSSMLSISQGTFCFINSIFDMFGIMVILII